MSYISTDQFIEAFAAKLVASGEHSIKLNRGDVRDRLFSVYQRLNNFIDTIKSQAEADEDFLDSLINIRNIFKPSPIGAFDNLEAILRYKQDTLTEHPNPYYQDIVIKIPLEDAKSVLDRLTSSEKLVLDAAIGSYRVCDEDVEH